MPNQYSAYVLYTILSLECIVLSDKHHADIALLCQNGFSCILFLSGIRFFIALGVSPYLLRFLYSFGIFLKFPSVKQRGFLLHRQTSDALFTKHIPK